MAKDEIRYKKPWYKINEQFLSYLKEHNRFAPIPILYSDLLRFQNGLPVIDNRGNDTLWLRVFFTEREKEEVDFALKKIYSLLHVDGGEDVVQYLNVDAIDFCTFGNTKPFRIKIRNILNDNYVYFYVKKADASRVYGLELEEILSPNQVNYLVEGETLIEEHIFGIPGDVFYERYLDDCTDNQKSEIAKEFVKFNERCFVRLLGDMRSYNYVVVQTHDFDRIQYRFKAIDFDQQSYEGDMDIYLPEKMDDNKHIVDVLNELLTEKSIEQYKREERALIAKRAFSNKERLLDLINSMKQDTLSSNKNVVKLRMHLFKLTKDIKFKKAKNMGELLDSALDFVLRNYQDLNLYLIDKR